MKKSIVILIAVIAVGVFAFKPAATSMSFVTLETRVTGLPSSVNGGWSFPFVMFYGVSGNPYNVRQGDAWAFSAYHSMNVVAASTDTTTVYQAARDSASAYRVRTYPNVH